MKPYKLIFDELEKQKTGQLNINQVELIIKESKNINELRELSSAIKKPQPTTFCFC
ncbi:hypothetical protein QUG28_17040 [Bacillus hominis]|uniref:hypothetical protein n=1 Tax=Bacillus hominis TaxID=2817478 RepID=UPI0025A113CE|nr:hypothetical protein [Bacillus hominis]MDM5434402.1 hypothetical protein [Bacillus hominis]